MQRLASCFSPYVLLKPCGAGDGTKVASLSVSNVNLMRGYEQKTSFVSPFMYDHVT